MHKYSITNNQNLPDLNCLHLGPDLKDQKYPAPLFLSSWFQPPPDKAGENEVEEEAGEDNKEAAHMLRVQLVNQSDVKVDVDEGQDDVEGQQLQHWGHKVLDKPRNL